MITGLMLIHRKHDTVNHVILEMQLQSKGNYVKMTVEFHIYSFSMTSQLSLFGLQVKKYFFKLPAVQTEL